MKFLLLLAFFVGAYCFQRPSFHRGFGSSKLHAEASDPTKDFFKKVSNAIDNAGGVEGILNKTGEAAKKAGEAAVKAAEAAKKLNDEYKITDKLVDASKAAGNKALLLNEEYKLTDKAVSAAKEAAEKAAAKIKEASK
jgi:uncharacterized phage infection (PIP) family protein YhgE